MINHHLARGKLQGSRWDGMDSCVIPTMKKKRVKDIEQLYVLQLDDDPIQIGRNQCTLSCKESGNRYISVRSKPDAIIGTNALLMPILLELDGYLKEDTCVYVLDTPERIEAFLADDFHRQELETVRNIHIEWVGMLIDEYNRLHDFMCNEQLKELRSVIILTDDSQQEEESSAQEWKKVADHKTLARLLALRKIKSDILPQLSITCEMNLEENKQLAERTGTEDYIVGSDITALLITQIAQTRQLHRIFYELLDEMGSEIYMHRAYKYLQFENKKNVKKTIDLPTLAAMLAQQNEVFIGYRKVNENNVYDEPCLNPPKWHKDGTAVSVDFGNKDCIITIANQSYE